MVWCNRRSERCLQMRIIQHRSLGRYHATWVKPLARFLHVQKLVKRRASYKESRKVLQETDVTIAMNVERLLLRVQA